MEKDKFKKGIEEIKNIKMTSLEKKHMIGNILRSPLTDTTNSVVSPYTLYSFFSIISKKRLIHFAFVFCLVIVLSSGAVFASEDSLPGNALYPLKVKVVEPITGVLIFSPIEKVEYQNNLATKRLVEAQVLANEDKLDSTKEEELNSLLENHTLAFNTAVEEFFKDQKTEQELSENIINTFQISMNANAKVLDIIISDKHPEALSSGNTETKISKTAKEKARMAKIIQKERQIVQEPEEVEKYKERKEIIRALITKTTDDLKKTDTSNSKRRQIVVDTATQTLFDATKLLDESDEDEMKGDSQNAVEKILNSENSTKEVEILLKSRLGL